MVKKIVSLFAVLSFLFGFDPVLGFAAGKTWAVSDDLTVQSEGAYILKGYIEDYVVMDNGNILGLFRSDKGKKQLRFFLRYSSKGLLYESAEVVKKRSGTVNMVVIEGNIRDKDGEPELNVFCVAPDFG